MCELKNPTKVMKATASGGKKWIKVTDEGVAGPSPVLHPTCAKSQ